MGKAIHIYNTLIKVTYKSAIHTVIGFIHLFFHFTVSYISKKCISVSPTDSNTATTNKHTSPSHPSTPHTYTHKHPTHTHTLTHTHTHCLSRTPYTHLTHIQNNIEGVLISLMMGFSTLSSFLTFFPLLHEKCSSHATKSL